MLRSKLIRLVCLVAGLVITTIGQTAPVLSDTDWPMHGNNAGETRYASETMVNRDNIQRLGLAWHFRFDRPRGVQGS